MPVSHAPRRDYYFTGRENTKTMMPHPEQPAKKYNLFMRRMLTGSDFTELGVVNSERYGEWDKTPLQGLSTVNYIEDYWYTYIPGYGNLTALQCAQLDSLTEGYRCLTTEECKAAGKALTPQSGFTRCDSFKTGLPNPDGLRRIKLDTGVQTPSPPVQVHIHAMEYDLMSRSILALVTGYPLDAPAVTNELRPQNILSLVAINETTGRIFDCTDDPTTSDPACHPQVASGQQSVTFCKNCPTSPRNLATAWTATVTRNLPHDYTSVVGGAAATAMDTYGQTFFCILSNPREPGSQTLFGIKRLAIYGEDEAPESPYSRQRGGFTSYTELGAKAGLFIVELQWNHFFYYKFPEELLVMGLEFGPKRVTKKGVGYEPIADTAEYPDEKTLFAHCTIKEKGPCEAHRCGGRLTEDDDLTAYADKQIGQKCLCTTAVVQLNVDAEVINAAKGNEVMTMGFAAGEENAETRSMGTNNATALREQYVVLGALNDYTEGPQKYVPAGDEGTKRRLLIEGEKAETERQNVTNPEVMSLDDFRSRAFDYVVLESSKENPGAVMEELRVGRARAEAAAGRRLAQDTADDGDEGAHVLESAKHPFDHIQYGVSALLSGQSSATGDARAGAYYFPTWENPGRTHDPNKDGKHYLYEFGLKGQRAAGFYNLEGVLTPWNETTIYPDCYTKAFCELVKKNKGKDEAGDALYASSYEQAPFNCLCDEDEVKCNYCIRPADGGMQITRQIASNAFTVFLHNTGQDSKASEARISDAQYDLPTVATNSYPEQGQYMIQGKGKFFARAGETAAFTIQSINRFGYQQGFTNSDNFTVTITGPGFPQADTNQDCTATICAADPVENPNDLPTYPIMLGPVWRDYDQPGGTLEFVDPREGAFPNVHDERYSTMQRDPLNPASPPTGGDAKCNSGGKTDHMELNINKNKCVRRLKRPVYIMGSRGQYSVEFRVDRAGEYVVKLTSRGLQPIIDKKGKLNLGANLGAGLYQLTVEPGEPIAQFTTSNLDLPEVAGRATIGEISNFTIFSRDRFGNQAIKGGSQVSVTMTGPKYILCDLPFKTKVDPVTGVESRVNPYNESLFVDGWEDEETSGYPSETIIEPTAAQKADPKLLLYYTSYCMIQDMDDGTYTVEYYITKKNKGRTEYTVDVNLYNKASVESVIKGSPFLMTVKQGRTDAKKSFAKNRQGEAFGTANTVAGFLTTINVQARDRFGNLQNEGGDPFGANVTDSLGQAVARMLPDLTIGKGTAGRHLMQVDGFDPPAIDIKYADEGIYEVMYQVFKAGEADLVVFRMGINIGPPDDASNQGSPYRVTVRSAATDPANTMALPNMMQGLVNLTAGDRGDFEGAVGVPFTIQLRDKYNNEKEEAEDVFFVNPFDKLSVSQPTQNFPSPQFQYNIKTEGVKLTPKAKAGVVTRVTEGVEIIEEPINEFYSTTTGLTPDYNVRYIGNGRFTTYWTTTLAGQYDIAVTIRPTNDRGEFAAPTFEPICADVPCTPDGRGQASVSPYSNPFSCRVDPAEFDIRMSELYFWDPTAQELASANIKRDPATHIFYSSLNTLTHNFKMSDGRPVQPAKASNFKITGISGSESVFYFQARDKFGNIKKESGITLKVTLTSQYGEAFELYTTPQFEVPKWQVTDGIEGGAVEDLGDGIYKIAYMVKRTGFYALSIIDEKTGHELRKLDAKNPETLSTLGYSTWSFGDIFTIEIKPSSTSSKFSSAAGDGLRGGVRNVPLEITILAKDQLGNPKTNPDEDESALFALSVSRCGATLPVASCGTPLTAKTWEIAGDTAFAKIGGVSRSAMPGQYRVSWTPIGQAGFYYKIIVTYDRDGPGPSPPAVLGGASSLLWTKEEINAGATQQMEDGTVYMNDYVDVYKFPRAPLVGQPVFFPVFAMVLAGAGDASVAESEVYHYVNGNFDNRFTGGVVGTSQQFILKVISFQRVALTEPGKLAVIRATFKHVDDENPAVVVEQVLANPGVDCIVKPGDANGEASITDLGDGTYLVSVPEDTRDVTETSKLLNVAYERKPNALTKAGDYIVTFEANTDVTCNQPVKRMKGYTAGLTPYYGAVTMTPTDTNRETSTLARADGTAMDAAGFTEDAGAEVRLTLQARDKFDNLQKWTAFAGGDPFLGQLVRPSGGQDPQMDAVTVDLRNGRYELVYTQRVASLYEFTAYLGIAEGSNVVTNLRNVLGGRHFPVRIKPGPRYVPRCTATGAGIEPGTDDPIVNIQNSLYIQEADEFGNKRSEFTIINAAVANFEVTFTKKTAPQARRSWKQTYSVAPEATGGRHEVVYVPGKEEGNDLPPLAGQFEVDIGVDGTRIQGSPFSIAFSPGKIDITATEVSGPGVSFNMMNPGTTRAGIEAFFTIQAKDQFGNKLVKSPEPPSEDRGFFDVKLKPFGPLFKGSSVRGNITDFGNGTYLAKYIAKSNGQVLLTVNDGTVPTSQFKYQPTMGGPIEPRPNEDAERGTGGMPYFDQNKIFDYVAAPGETEEQGVVVNIRPGPLSPQYTQVSGPAIVGGGKCPEACGEMEAGQVGGLNIIITARDFFRQPKNDLDDDQELYAYLEYFANARDRETNDPLVNGVLNPTTEGFESMWQFPNGTENKAPDGTWICAPPNCMILKQVFEETNGEATELYTIDPNLEAHLAVSGFYRLHVKVRKYRISKLHGEVEYDRPVGEGYGLDGTLLQTREGDSPFEFYVLPARSDTGKSDLNSPATPAKRRRLRALLHDMSQSFTPDIPTPEEAYHEDVDEEEEANAVEWVPVEARRALLGDDAAGVQGRRQLLQADNKTANLIVAQAGVVKQLKIALKDSLGNPQVANPLRRLDKVDVRLGESTCLNETCLDGSGSPACQWQKRDRLLPVLLPTPNCVPVFTGSKLVGGAQDAPVYPAPPLFSNGSTPGLSLDVKNDFAAGSFEISFTIDSQLPANPDYYYLLELYLNGKHLGRSPYTVMIIPGPVSGAMSEPDSRISATMTVDTDITFGYNARDRYGNAQQDSSEPEKIQVDLRIMKRSITGMEMIIRGCTSNAPDSGDCGFEVRVSGEPKGKVTAGNYTVAFKTLTASSFGNDYEMRLRFCASAAYCDNRMNAFNPAGRDKAGSFLPYRLKIDPGPTGSADCTAEGLDLLEGGLIDQFARFTIIARDKHRNRRMIGGELFEVLIYQPQGQGLMRDVQVRDLNDGAYQVSFRPLYEGLHSIIILLGPTPISGSPFSPEFRAKDGDLVARRSRLVNDLGVELPQLPAVTAGEQININVRAYAEITMGFPKSKRTGGDTIYATVTGGGLSQGVALEVVDGASVGGSGGQYNVRANALGPLQRSGKYSLSIKACSGFCVKSIAQPIKGSPFALVIQPAETVPSTSRALELTDWTTQINGGAGWRAGSTAPMSFRVQARDRFGNNQEYAYLKDNFNSFDVRIIGDRGDRMTPVQTDDPNSILAGQVTTQYNSFGVHTVSFRTNIAQNYTFEISLNGVPIANSPATVPVYPAEVDFENCIVQLNARGGRVGLTHTMVLYARDAFGNEIKHGGHEFKMRMANENRFEEQGSGDNPLVAQAKVLLKSQTAAEDPYSRTGLFVYAFDGKEVESGITVTDLNTGMYIINYISQRSGAATLEVFMDQLVDEVNNVATVSKKACTNPNARALCEQVASFDDDGNIKLTFDKMEPDPTETLIESATSSLSSVRAGEEASFTILPYDIYRNPLNDEGYTFTVSLTNKADKRRVLGSVNYNTRTKRYIGRYTVDFAGDYIMYVRRTGRDLTAFVGGDRVKTPFESLKVVPGLTSGATTVITHQEQSVALKKNEPAKRYFVAIAGEKQTFRIDTFDANMNRRVGGGEKFVISLGLLDQGTFVDLNNGTYIGEYQLVVAGEYDMSVTVAEQPVQQPTRLYDPAQETFPVLVLAAAVDPTQCVAFGAGLRSALAGEAATFNIQARDRFQNKKIFGGDSFWGSFTQEGRTSDVNATDNNDGTYSITYTLTTSGYYTIKLSHPLKEGFFEQTPDRRVMMLNNPAAISLKSFASGPGLLSGSESCTVKAKQNFHITLKDHYLNNITVGDSAGFAISIATGRGPFYDFERRQQDVFPVEAVFPTSNDLEPYLEAFPYRMTPNVYYDASYNTPTSGLYEVSIKYYGRHLQGSPYKVVVISDVTVDKARCQAEAPVTMCTYITGKALREGIVSPTSDSTPVSPKAEFTIHARDRYGNDAVSGGDTWIILVTRPDGLRYGTANSGEEELVTVTDKNDGTYAVTWEYNRQGSHTIAVSLARNRKNVLCGDLDGDGIVDEVCHVEFSPASPRVLRVNAGALQPPNPESSYAYGDGVHAAQAGIPSSVFVQSRKLRVKTSTFDEFNKSCITGGATLEAKAFNPVPVGMDESNVTSADGFSFSVVDNKDGTYEVVYVSKHVGKFWIDMTMNGEAIGVCPNALGCEDAAVMPFIRRSVTVYPGPTSPNTSTAEVTGGTTPAAGRRTSFTIMARDAVGNVQQDRPYVLTKDAFEVYLKRDGVPLTFTESNTLTKSVTLNPLETGGGYTVEYLPRISGVYSIHVELGGVPIKGTPFQQEVVAGAISARYTTMSGVKAGQTLTEAIGTAKALDWMNFTIQAADDYRNPLTFGGDSFKMFVQIIRVESNEEFIADIKDNGDGTYMSSFMPTLTGTYTVLLAINGVKVLPTAGLKVTGQGEIREVAVYAPLTEAQGAAVEMVTAGIASFFEVQAYDRQGRVKKAGGDVVNVQILPKTSRNEYGITLRPHIPKVRDQSLFTRVDKSAVPGRYRVSTKIDEFGAYSMLITINGRPIKDSPFTLTVMRLFPPVQDVARFSNTATRIETQFTDISEEPQPTNRAGLIGIESCEKVLVPDTVARLGSGPLCSFPNDYKLEIYLGYAATIMPNDFITLKPTALVNKQRNSFYTTGSAIVERPVIAPKPKLVVRAPTILSVCDDYVLDVSGSYGTAGRQLNFSYGLYPNVPNEHEISEMLTRFSQSNTVNVVNIPGNLLKPDITYRFVVQVKNFLREETRRTVSVVRRSYAVPRVLVQGDPVLRTFRDKGLYVKSAVSVPLGTSGNGTNITSCFVPYPEMTFKWSYDTSTAEARRGSTFAIDPKTRMSKTLYIAPYSLTSGETYFLKVVGCVKGQPGLCNQATARVEVRFSSVNVKVAAPKVLKPLDGLIINASSSVDPDDPNPGKPTFPYGPFMYRWRCINVTTDGKTPEPFPLDSCFSDTLGVMNPDPLVPWLEVPPGYLKVGKYMFVLTFSKEPLYSPEGQIPGRMDSVRRIVTVESPAKPKLLSNLTLLANFSQFQADPMAFQTALIADLAASIGVSASRVVIRKVASGSVMVDFEILSPSLADGDSAKSLSAIIDEASLGKTVTFTNMQQYLNITVPSVDLPVNMTEVTEDVASDAVMPVVIIQPLQSNVVNANEQLVLAAGIQILPGQNISLLRNQTMYKWDVIQGVLEFDYPAKLATPRTNNNLVVRKNVLAPGQTYLLRLTAINTASGLTGFDEVSFVVNGAPSSGTFEVTPSVGYAGETTFELRCMGWEDDGTDPVEYEFRYYHPDTGAQVPLVARARDNEVVTIAPPVTAERSEYQLVITAYVVDFYNAKTQVNRTIVVKPPKYDETTSATMANGSYPYNLSGSLAFTQNLLDAQLRTAQGTNNVPLLLTIAQTVVDVNNKVGKERLRVPKPVVLPGLDYTPAQRAQLDADAFYLKESTRQLTAIMESLDAAIKSVKVSKEELDQFAAVTAASTQGTESLAGGDNAASAQNSVLELAKASKDSGLDDVAAQGLLDSAGSILDATVDNTAGLTAGRASLLGNSSAPEQAANASAAAKAKAEKSAAATNEIVKSISKSGVSGGVEGQEAFSVSAPNLQVKAFVASGDTVGSVSMPPPPGKNASSAPSFNIPPGMDTPDSDNEILTSVSNKNIYSFSNDSARIRGDTASFTVYPKGGASEKQVQNLTLPFQIKIPVTISGSSCRKTTGGCRYWDHKKNQWSTEGLFEKERTKEYILCESTHLSDFAVSADDIVPEFNLVNPVDAGDLFSNLSMDNAVVLFVIGIILAGFAAMNFVGYKRDIRDRERLRVEQKIATIDSRLTRSKMYAVGAAAIAGAGAVGTSGKIVKPPKAVLAGEQIGLTEADLNEGTQSWQQKLSVAFNALREKHVVVGIIECKPSDDFTRPQRLICLLCLVFGQFAASAIFFGIDPSNIAMKAVIGILTSVILTPSKVFFRLLFEKSTYRAPPKRSETRATLAKTRREKLKRGALLTTGSNAFDSTNRLDEEEEAGRRAMESRREARLSEPGAAPPGGPLKRTSSSVKNPRSSLKKVSSYGPAGSADFGGIWPKGVQKNGPKAAPTGPAASNPAGRPRRRKPTGQSTWATAAAAATAATAFFVPPPPAGDAAARPRRRVKASSRVSPSDIFDGVNPGAEGVSTRPGTAPGGSAAGSVAGGIPAPPPLPEGAAMRPRRRAAMIGAAAIQAASKFKKGLLGEGGSVTPEGLVAPPPAALGGRGGRPVRKKSRAAGLAAAGAANMEAAAAAGGVEDVTGGAQPPPPGASGGRPRRSGGSPSVAPPTRDTLVGMDSPGGEAPKTPPRVAQHDANTRLAMLASVSRALQRSRPGAGRSRRPGLGPFDVERRKRMAGAVVNQQESALGRPRPRARLNADEEDKVMAHYVPEPILRVVRRIQRSWRRKMAIRERERVRAARVFQKYYRGVMDRRKVELIKQGKASGMETGRQLWWVSAHAPGTQLNAGASAEELEAEARKKEEEAKKEVHGSRQEELVNKWMGGANKKLQVELAKADEAAKPKAVRDAERAKEKAKQEGGDRPRGGLRLPPPDADRAKKRRKRKKARRHAGKKGLPRWFIYVAYALSFTFCAVAAFFMMLYGIAFEPPVARAWLLSGGLSVLLEMFVQDPLKISGLGVIQARIQEELDKSRKRREQKRFEERMIA